MLESDIMVNFCLTGRVVRRFGGGIVSRREWRLQEGSTQTVDGVMWNSNRRVTRCYAVTSVSTDVFGKVS